MRITLLLLSITMMAISAVPGLTATTPSEPASVPVSTHNLLLEATLSGNLDSYQKGLRGAPDHLIYDVPRGRFAKESEWHEYGVGYNADLGVVSEDKPAYWLAQWSQPVEANFIALSGV
ncbi:MAG TPA: hypothetical protein VEC99_13010, partial [Clostridia bacterium]|nr:hypothetical protein [Clostridia bacterium]